VLNYNTHAIRKTLEAGVKSIEYGYLVEEATLKLIAEKHTWSEKLGSASGFAPLRIHLTELLHIDVCVD
jgi:imidazolonepropionase-like amidohydrolase